MALQITNVSTLKSSEVEINEAKKVYDDALKEVEQAVKSLEECWNDNDGIEYKENLLNLINGDLKDISDEMQFEINYIKKISMVLENAQQEIKNRINN